MEYFAFSHNDEQYRITANHDEYLKISTIDADGNTIPFYPPAENRYDQILRCKFGLGQDAFEKLRRDQLSNWQITETTIYASALSIRHQSVFDKPIAKSEGIRTFHGIRAEQALIETIPYDNIGHTDFTLIIEIKNSHNETRAKWTVSVSKNSIVITPPGGMDYNLNHIHL